METRKITFVSTRSSKNSVIESNATTLKELKADMDKAGIDYDGMTFFEGTSKTELSHDDAILPHDVPFKGSTTNNLVFMLTSPNKKIKSGAIDNRKDAGIFFRENPSIAVKFKAAHNGRNWTNCTTGEILSFLDTEVEEKDQAESAGVVVDMTARTAIKTLVEALWDDDYIQTSVRDDIFRILDNAEGLEDEIESPYSEEELDDMFDGML